MSGWDERFRQGEYPTEPEPSPILQGYLPALPDGRALDIATGTGRNALLLAAAGYEVDAIDRSVAGLHIARETARERGLDSQISWIQADVPEFVFPPDRYAVVTISFYRAVDRLPDIKTSLIDGGYLFVEHHLRSTDGSQIGPDTDRYRFGANELLNTCLDMTVLFYDAGIEIRSDGRRSCTARIVARNTDGIAQSYPPRLRCETPHEQ